MKLIVYLMILLFEPIQCFSSDDAGSYFETLRRSGHANSAVEQQLLALSTEQLTKQLAPYYTDTFSVIRQKSYYLTYKRGIRDIPAGRRIAAKQLLQGCDDPDGGLVGQTLRYLQEFSRDDFDGECKKIINGKIERTQMPHYRELVLLAGYTGTGKDELSALLSDLHVPERYRWYVSLALARMGDAVQTANCVNRVRKLPVNNDLMEYILPDLIYTRQREALDYCVGLLLEYTGLCESQNPDVSEKINCAFLMIPLLAPAITDFPVVIDASGDIAGDYQKALRDLKKWFSTNREYDISDVQF
jgi:hypothetical protein